MYMNGHGITIFNEKQDTFLDMVKHFTAILKSCKTMEKKKRVET
jgi:hypothetical protein